MSPPGSKRGDEKFGATRRPDAEGTRRENVMNIAAVEGRGAIFRFELGDRKKVREQEARSMAIARINEHCAIIIYRFARNTFA